jgi:hypothetical protein
MINSTATMTAAPPLEPLVEPESDNYLTSELDIASYLVASGYQVLNSRPLGHLVEFAFDPSASHAVEKYFAGSSLPVQEVFSAHRRLRTIIKQIKIHNGVTTRVYQPRKS